MPEVWDMSGPLAKQRRVRFHEKWFGLRGQHLHVFASSEASVAKHIINLCDAEIISSVVHLPEYGRSPTAGLLFVLRGPHFPKPDKPYVLRGLTAEDKVRWCAALTAAIQTAQPVDPMELRRLSDSYDHPFSSSSSLSPSPSPTPSHSPGWPSPSAFFNRKAAAASAAAGVGIGVGESPQSRSPCHPASPSLFPRSRTAEELRSALVGGNSSSTKPPLHGSNSSDNFLGADFRSSTASAAAAATGASVSCPAAPLRAPSSPRPIPNTSSAAAVAAAALYSAALPGRFFPTSPAAAPPSALNPLIRQLRRTPSSSTSSSNAPMTPAMAGDNGGALEGNRLPSISSSSFSSASSATSASTSSLFAAAAAAASSSASPTLIVPTLVLEGVGSEKQDAHQFAMPQEGPPGLGHAALLSAEIVVTPPTGDRNHTSSTPFSTDRSHDNATAIEESATAPVPAVLLGAAGRGTAAAVAAAAVTSLTPSAPPRLDANHLQLSNLPLVGHHRRAGSPSSTASGSSSGGLSVTPNAHHSGAKTSTVTVTTPITTPVTNKTTPIDTSSSEPILFTPTRSASVVAELDLVDWRKGQCLGKGAFGSVYLAMLRTGRFVAVKVVSIPPDLLEEEQQRNQQNHRRNSGGSNHSSTAKGPLALLRQEIELMQGLQHPNIVQYLGSTVTEDVVDDAQLLIFMEYMPQGSLRKVISKFGVLSEHTVRHYLRQMLSGLAYLHSHGVIHRDIKADNVLLDSEGCCKLSDFGCSKKLTMLVSYQSSRSSRSSSAGSGSSSSGNGEESQTGGAFLRCHTTVGTVYHMAPEVLKDEKYDEKADIWSLGCTVVEMVTGTHPWPEFENVWAAMYHISNATGLPTMINNSPSSSTKSNVSDSSTHPPLLLAFLESCFVRDARLRPSAMELLDHPFVKM